MGMIQVPNQTTADRLDQMVRQYEKDLLRICWIYLRDYAAAEDAVQETFLKAYKSLESFRGESSEKTWLTRIAINCCRDYRRSAWYRYMDFCVSIEQLPISSSAPPGDEQIALTLAIMKLKPKYLEAVLLYFYEGYSIKEITTLTEKLGRSLFWNDREIKSIQEVALTYEAVRADSKADGMVFVPVWMILYQDPSAAANDTTCYALISAVNGTLIDASFH